MRLSVPYNPDPEVFEEICGFGEVKEVYGKLRQDIIGGGRSSYTLPSVTLKKLEKQIGHGAEKGVVFNYLLNAASLDGSEQTRRGQKRIRRFIDQICDAGVRAVTVSSPLLLRILKKEYPQLSVRVGVFAMVGNLGKARQWEDLGADVICLSAIAVNRNFDELKRLREGVSCGLQLLVNASCLRDCSWELAHMNMLTQASRTGHQNRGFNLDYCFLHCSGTRIKNPVNYIRSIWIRPEDIYLYESMGYDDFKLVERSCPGDLLILRIKAYIKRNFEGNLLELVGPVARVKMEQGMRKREYLSMLRRMVHPGKIKISSLLKFKNYCEEVIPGLYDEKSPVYIDNRSLDGYLEEIRNRNCQSRGCLDCGYCKKIAGKVVRVNEEWQRRMIQKNRKLWEEMDCGRFW
ncbi:peptidase U32 [Chitinispirillum alkaliphilum]|nr:peptidase U32 [Chitinispirillum alkaliphilum]